MRYASTSAPAPPRQHLGSCWRAARAGVPVTGKASQYMAGIPTMHASRAVEPYVPSETVAAVERLEAAGAVVYAKTTTPEFCYFGYTESERHGRTANPHDLSRTAGGSS